MVSYRIKQFLFLLLVLSKPRYLSASHHALTMFWVCFIDNPGNNLV
ncbi:hypothetical protein CRD_02377 [Raphidiopsis brookii D9]|nr:hypothetical protein CRD_02377 [Raphidiopsis brookii D9]